MPFLNFKEILELIDKVADRGLSSLEIEVAGLKLRLQGKQAEILQIQSSPLPPAHQSHVAASGAPSPSPPPAQTSTPASADVEAEDSSLHVITSPIVGTFYRSPNPESQFFVNVGDRITKGKVLCIVEAMKLMNEIESEVDGVITRIYPQNGQPIEYGEKLFAVKL
ncbi:MAG TPA: acetyl-CoA carboxylase biotin carboxyl carrier protein [Thermoanaerobaculia bacterium]|nr:acetyl-CoA carboxylase biotin carboxyl carrier protein [Thermoanaerobaculia bacterium]